MNLNYSLAEQDGIQVLQIKDLLSEHANREIIKAVEHKLSEGYSSFVVDLGAIEYMNSVGLNFLLTMRARSKEKGGGLVVANVSEKVKSLLDMTKLTPMFVMTASVEQALQEVQQN
ncbi:MAG: STAS domain-containing protein [Phaeodactylibacter sp.]|uniref:STAS domain-containing protein n=1 Tax=Phaeodactylibacter sp. TaxID=1940289 RepID=UPI0032ECB132